MFDISFVELLVCLVVALVVIGPEQLPQTVRSIGLWIGRLKRSLRDTRSELERQLGADDIRRQLHNEDIMRSIEQTRSMMEKTINEGGDGLRAALDQADADSEARKQAQQQHYGSPEELPDHAHTDNTAAPTADIAQPATAAETTSTDAPATEPTSAPASGDADLHSQKQ